MLTIRPVRERGRSVETEEVGCDGTRADQTRRGGDDDEGVDGVDAAGQERREKLAEDTDDLLDEIDDVLEENAEDFVRAYVQKGGQ